ncbi:MAG: polysaccharide deacetylase family protein [Sulfurovaceae bacterium]|nr:polysaccharide deacetylase family protein [Sulfurovaceae bacterium]MDD5549441.1 polysaccharide deacetylase family protein [Sulfurovaceae bacterium]
MKNKSVNFLTFDIEEWFHANYRDLNANDYSNISDTNLEANIDRLIAICDKNNVKSTCFILGDVARKKPHLIKKLFDAGHEIASHGNSHKQIYSMRQKEFTEDIHKSTDILEQITGQKVVGFRAPSWSIKDETVKWFYEILANEGYIYSSSVYPAEHKLFGIKDFDKTPHYPTNHKILEIPQSTTNIFGFETGYAGGAFLRIFPEWFIKYNIKKYNQRNLPVFLYLHPREIDTMEPKLKLNFIDSFFHYHNTGIKCEQKTSNLIKEFSNSFIKMGDFAIKYNQL